MSSGRPSADRQAGTYDSIGETRRLRSKPLPRVRLTVVTPSGSMVCKVEFWLSHLMCRGMAGAVLLPTVGCSWCGAGPVPWCLTRCRALTAYGVRRAGAGCVMPNAKSVIQPRTRCSRCLPQIAGSIAHFQEAANRLEGRVEAADESHGNVSFRITISAPRPHRPAPIEVAPTTSRELDSGGHAEKRFSRSLGPLSQVKTRSDHVC